MAFAALPVHFRCLPVLRQTAAAIGELLLHRGLPVEQLQLQLPVAASGAAWSAAFS